MTPQYYYGDTLTVIANNAKKTSNLDSANYALLDDSCAVLDPNYPLPNTDMEDAWVKAEAVAVEENPILGTLLQYDDY